MISPFTDQIHHVTAIPHLLADFAISDAISDPGSEVGVGCRVGAPSPGSLLRHLPCLLALRRAPAQGRELGGGSRGWAHGDLPSAWCHLWFENRTGGARREKTCDFLKDKSGQTHKYTRYIHRKADKFTMKSMKLMCFCVFWGWFGSEFGRSWWSQFRMERIHCELRAECRWHRCLQSRSEGWRTFCPSAFRHCYRPDIFSGHVPILLDGVTVFCVILFSSQLLATKILQIIAVYRSKNG